MKKLIGSLSRIITGFAILFLVVSISDSCTKDDSPIGNEHQDQLYNVKVGAAFDPVEFSISAGDMVTWRNNSTMIQSVTSDDGIFDGIISSGGSYSFKFYSPGTYNYHSRINPGMTGRVIVK